MNYSKSQQEAIRHKDGPMLVLAGPGSGKTAVITQRTIHLIEQHHVNPRSGAGNEAALSGGNGDR